MLTASFKGHPIHPMLVVLPLGLWMFALVCDVATLLGGGPGWQTTRALPSSSKKSWSFRPIRNGRIVRIDVVAAQDARPKKILSIVARVLSFIIVSISIVARRRRSISGSAIRWFAASAKKATSFSRPAMAFATRRS